MELRIKEIAKQKGLTYKDIAERFNPVVSEQNIKQTLLNANKGKSLSTATLEQFATALDVPMWMLLVSPEEASSHVPTNESAIVCPHCGNRIKLKAE